MTYNLKAADGTFQAPADIDKGVTASQNLAGETDFHEKCSLEFFFHKIFVLILATSDNEKNQQ